MILKYCYVNIYNSISYNNLFNLLYHITLTCSICVHLFATDIDECANENAECNHLCINEYGSYHCQCHNGYTLIDAHSCFGEAISNLYFNLIIAVVITRYLCS